MSQVDRSVTNHEVIPIISSSVFEGRPGAVLAGGTLAIDGAAVPGLEAVYAAHFLLRKRVYVDQTGQLSRADLDVDGTDRDDDDARSITFGVLENHERGVRVVGVSRLIVRGAARPLPIEEFCGELFENPGLPPLSVEVSRVIARHERARRQNQIQLHLFSQMLAHLDLHGLGPTYAILEPWLERHVRGVLKIERIGEPRFIDHYLDVNVPIRVDVEKSIERMRDRGSDLIDRYRSADPELVLFEDRTQARPVREEAR